MEGVFFLLDVGLMVVLMFSILRAERGKDRDGKNENLGFFAYKEHPDAEDRSRNR